MTKRLHQPSLLEVNPHARRGGDFYRTPAWMTRALLARCPIPENLPGVVLEPCAGDGAIVEELERPLAPLIVTNDITPRGGFLPDFLEDATRPDAWRRFAALRPIAIVVTNPPFGLAFPIVQLAVEHASVGVAMLLRITWSEPTKERGDWLKAHPPTLIVLPRWKFRGAGSGDTATVAWFLWARQPWFDLPRNDFVTRAEAKDLAKVRLRL